MNYESVGAKQMNELICWSCGRLNVGTEKSCADCGAPLDERMSNAMRQHLSNARMKALLIYAVEGVLLVVTLAAIFVNVQQARDVHSYPQNQSKLAPIPTASPTSTPVATPPGKRRKR
jgi:hypothetical protein